MLVLSLLFEPNVGSDVAETCCFFVIVDGCLENLKLMMSTCLSKFKIFIGTLLEYSCNTFKFITVDIP